MQSPNKNEEDIRIAIWGGNGRMGNAIKAIFDSKDFAADGIKLVGTFSGKSKSDLESLEQSDAQVLIDFSAPSASIEAAKVCAKNRGIAHLVCTTGFSSEDSSELEKISSKNTWAKVPNTSIGIFALSQALSAALKILPKSFDLRQIEIHHSAKKDAPSGTGLFLENIAKQEGFSNISTISIRGGTEAGEHKIIMLGKAERIELMHRAENRNLFAYGALNLAKRLIKKPSRPLPYSLAELLQN